MACRSSNSGETAPPEPITHRSFPIYRNAINQHISIKVSTLWHEKHIHCIYRAVAISSEQACLIRDRSSVNFNNWRGVIPDLIANSIQRFLCQWTIFGLQQVFLFHPSTSLTRHQVCSSTSVIIPATVAFWQHPIIGLSGPWLANGVCCTLFFPPLGLEKIAWAFWSVE